jgi:hypothetical protein
MNKTALLFGVGASLILAAGPANAAGTCGAEVAELQQKLGAEEGANATICATDPGVQQPDPSASVDTSTSTTTGDDQIADADNEANATIGATDPGVQQPDPGASADTSTTTTTDGSTTTADTSYDYDGRHQHHGYRHHRCQCHDRRHRSGRAAAAGHRPGRQQRFEHHDDH